MKILPEVITHTYDPARGPCQNICYLPETDAENILNEIRVSSGQRAKSDYLKRRIVTEDWLISERRKKLGTTQLQRPIYFFLGDFADGKDLARPESLIMQLRSFPPETLTFTYPDSMASLPIAAGDEHRSHRRPYHGQVFTLDEISLVVSEFGMPGDRWKIDPAMKYDKFIEVQVWDDHPIKEWLGLR